MDKAQQQFFALLRAGLWDTSADAALFDDATDWDAVFTQAARQTVTGLVAAGVASLPAALQPPAAVGDRLRGIVTAGIRSHALLNRTLAEAVAMLRRGGIRPVLLKGQGVAANYAEPTLRMCGDIDLYIGRRDYARACELARRWNAEREVSVLLNEVKFASEREQRRSKLRICRAGANWIRLRRINDLPPRSTEPEILRYAQNDREAAQNDREAPLCHPERQRRISCHGAPDTGCFASLNMTKRSAEEPTESVKHYHFVHDGVTVELHRIAERLPLPWHNARFQRWTRCHLDEALAAGEKASVLLSEAEEHQPDAPFVLLNGLSVILSNAKDPGPQSTEEEILHSVQNDREAPLCPPERSEGSQAIRHRGSGCFASLNMTKGSKGADRGEAEDRRGNGEKRGGLREAVIGGATVALPPVGFDALYIFNHAWHHFSRGGGIGLRQLCDWVRYLHTFRGEIDHAALRRDLRAFGLWRPWRMFATIAVDVLGLPRAEYPFYTGRYARQAGRIMEMIAEEGNFGLCDAARTPRPDGYVAGKLHSVRWMCRRYVRLFRLFPGATAVAWACFLYDGIRRVVADQLHIKTRRQ